MELNIGTTIKKLRIARGITQEALARSMNVTYQAVSKWENNTTTPDISVLPKLAIYFGISMDELFSLDKEAHLKRIGNMIRDEYMIAPDQFVWAEDFLTQLIHEDENDSRARILLVELYCHRENRDQLSAIRLCKEGLAHDPANHVLHQKLIRLGKQREDTQMLRAFYQNLYQKYPQNDAVAEHRASISEEKTALAMITEHPTVKNMLLKGDILFTRGETRQARDLWKQIASDHPNDSSVLFAVAERFERHGFDDDAERYYLMAYRQTVSPKPLDALYALAFLYTRRQRYQDAIGMWEQIIADLKQDYGITKGESVDWAKREIAKLNDAISHGQNK